jgi:3',5'-cyclic AMP phosphodiesterase CpdA
MTRLLQISDPHFGTERAAVGDALIEWVWAQRPEVLLLSGDITQRATLAQFRAARAFVDRLGVATVLAVPGNHDIALFDPVERLLRPYHRYLQGFGPVLEPSFENEQVLVLTVNTTRWYRHKHGEVSAAQIERVAQRLEHAAPGQRRLVMLHQPVAVTQARDRVNLLRGHAAAVQRWAEAGVDLIIGGHIHLPYVLPLRERWPALPRPVWAVQAGTALSHRLRPEADNSVNLIRIDGSFVVERWDYTTAAAAFKRVSVTDCGAGASTASAPG